MKTSTGKSNVGVFFWRTLTIILAVILVTFISIILVGLFYTDYTGFKDSETTVRVEETFYLFNGKIYAPVSVTQDGRIDSGNIPYYYGKISDTISGIQFQNDPFADKEAKGEYLGNAEADFLYDTDNAMHMVEFYAVHMPDILWAESDDAQFLVAEITKPYSKKMLHPDTLADFATELVVCIEADNNLEMGQDNILGTSKYVNSFDQFCNTFFIFKRNLYFFIHDIKAIFT